MISSIILISVRSSDAGWICRALWASNWQALCYLLLSAAVDGQSVGKWAKSCGISVEVYRRNFPIKGHQGRRTWSYDGGPWSKSEQDSMVSFSVAQTKQNYSKNIQPQPPKPPPLIPNHIPSPETHLESPHRNNTLNLKNETVINLRLLPINTFKNPKLYEELRQYLFFSLTQVDIFIPFRTLPTRNALVIFVC